MLHRTSGRKIKGKSAPRYTRTPRVQYAPSYAAPQTPPHPHPHPHPPPRRVGSGPRTHRRARAHTPAIDSRMPIPTRLAVDVRICACCGRAYLRMLCACASASSPLARQLRPFPALTFAAAPPHAPLPLPMTKLCARMHMMRARQVPAPSTQLLQADSSRACAALSTRNPLTYPAPSLSSPSSLRLCMYTMPPHAVRTP
ncbi:hypothetical protein B0H16DRAFT_1591388 [Mycena metata]|uniref:Uncharacterized protein n=1 Tax=Mycena metata TaxID=1033252 RepID=A0AAD7MPL8_9AGAR|nr:hypothetical protein B0H16DRAFT_1591388 [Mycena metata]